jgi:hypothetical protein
VAGDRAGHGGFCSTCSLQRRSALVYRVAFRRRDDRLVSSVAMIMRLLASTAAPTNNVKRSTPSARQRFMPRPRISTEMRPSMPSVIFRLLTRRDGANWRTFRENF